MTDITCPKCFGTMKAIDRQGVVVERCESCGGVFLDKNELDQLIRLENDFIDQHLAVPVENREPRGSRDRRSYHDRQERGDDVADELFDDDLFDDVDLWDQDDRRERGDDRRGRKKSFLEELFDSIT